MNNTIRYDNETVRRQDRLLEETQAIELLRSGEYGFLSMLECHEGSLAAYGIPLNYVWDGLQSVYFHCAPEGHKLRCLRDNPSVSFCVIGQTRVIPHKFTTAYESILIRGKACLDLSDEEKMRALLLLADKYSPDDKEAGIKYSEKSFHRTGIIRLDIEWMSGKAKRINP